MTDRDPALPPRARNLLDRLPAWCRSEVLRAGSLAGMVQVSGLLLVFLLQVLLARVIVDPQAYGQYVWGQNLLYLLGGIAAMGLPAIAGRQVALHALHTDRSAQRAVLRRALTLVMTACTLLLALIALLLQFFQLPPSLSLPVAALALVGAPFAAMTLIFQSVTRARDRLMWAFLPYQVLRPLFTGALVLGLVISSGRGVSALQVLAAVCLSLVLVTLVQWSIERRALPGSPLLAMAPRPMSTLRLLRETLPAFAASLCALVMTYANTLVVGLIAGPAAAGAFFVAERLAQLAATPATVISAVVQPWLASAHAARDQSRLQTVATQAAHIGLWPTLLVVAGLWWFAEPLLRLFGSQFLHALPILAALLFAQGLGVALGPGQTVLIMSGNQAWVMRMAAVAAVSHLVLLAVLVPRWGALGAAVATVASTLLDTGGCLLLARSRLGLRMTVLGSLRRSAWQGAPGRDSGRADVTGQ